MNNIFRCICFLIFPFLCAGFISGCAPEKRFKPDQSFRRNHPKERFLESEYGVSSSPRISEEEARRKRRYHVGKPYKIRGKWYYPSEKRDYKKIGSASWYGKAFHGRLTANGEVFNMRSLTAAHPTMPLPSYVRVTNLKNKASLVVRVNDRGPYGGGADRIIDLSHRAAEMLDYAHKGIAAVSIQYLKRAPLHAQDERYLLTSWSPGKMGQFRKPLFSQADFNKTTQRQSSRLSSTPYANSNRQAYTSAYALTKGDVYKSKVESANVKSANQNGRNSSNRWTLQANQPKEETSPDKYYASIPNEEKISLPPSFDMPIKSSSSPKIIKLPESINIE